MRRQLGAEGAAGLVGAAKGSEPANGPTVAAGGANFVVLWLSLLITLTVADTSPVMKLVVGPFP